MKKKISMLFASLLMVISISLVGCSTEQKNEATKESEVVDKVGALKGPTSMGMVQMINESKENKNKEYNFTIYNSVDEIVPKVVSGEIDIAAIPSNVASVIYNKTKGKIDTLAINTLGVLYVVENGNSIKTIDDLKGKTIYSSGKGATPQFALDYILKKNKIDPQKDVNIEYKSEHTEALASLVNDKNGVAVLPQPFVTVAKAKNKNLSVVLDLTKEWDKVNKGGKDKGTLITGVLIARKDFVDKYPEKVKSFMNEYKKSVEFTNKNVEEAAKLIGENKIVPTPIAKAAIPKCNITYIDGKEMKDKLSGYLKVLYDANPKSIGGQMPGEDFYYVQKNK